MAIGVFGAGVRSATFSVTSTADTGAPGTLRWAVNQANAAGAGSHSILFSLPASSTIALASPLPTLDNASATITINGAGASGLSVSGVSPNQIFSVQNGPVTITNLTVAGTGSMSKVGTGTLTLSGTNAYSGGTTVSAGVLQGNTASLQGNISDDANVTFNQTSVGTYSGVVSGTGSLTKIGTSTLTLSGANTYSGGTTVSAGILQGTTTSLPGNVTNNANVTLNQATAGTYSGVMSGTGSLTKTGAGTVTLSGANTYSGGTTVSAGALHGDTTSVRGNITNNANVTYNQATTGTYSGVMSGTGSLTKSGTGTVVLSGANTYTGGTTVSAGVLQGTTTSVRGNIVNNANVTYDQSTTGTYSGVMSGTGSLTKTGTGTAILSGANTYSGGTTVSAGTLQGNTTSVRGTIDNNANVTFNQTSVGTYSGVVSGTGSLTKIGTSTLTLSGANTYTGGTTVSAGILQGTTTSLPGNVTNNANVTLNQATAGTYSGVMSGTGSLTKTGAGTVTLSGANTYSGGTTVSAGALHGDTTSVRGNITNNANVTYNQATTGTYSGVMSGTGSLTKTGTGTAILSGANTYTGNTSIVEGLLAVDGSLTSDVTVGPNGVLGGNGTVSGDVDNQGAVAGGNSIGTLSIGGNYTQATGSTTQVEINNGGTVPGVNNDLVDVAGTATISGGTVEVSLAPGGYDIGTRYTFLTASGGVNGVFAGIVDDSDFLRGELGYTADTAYFTLTFAQTDFAAIAETPNEFAVANYLDDISTIASGDLQVVLIDLSLANDDEARSALNQIGGEIYGTLGQVGVQGTTLVLAQLSQRIRMGTLTDLGDSSHLAPVQSESAAPYTLTSYSRHPGRRPRKCFVEEQPRCEWKDWAFGFGLSGAANSDGNATGFNSGTGGMLIGTERRLFDNDRLGFYGGYLGTQVSTTNPDQSGSIHGGQFGSYTYHEDGLNYNTFIGGFQFNGYDTDRRLRFNGIVREADGNFSGWQGFAYLERGVKFQSPRFLLQPYGALQYIYLRQNSFTETGADSLNLTVTGLDAHTLRSQLGGRLQVNRWTHNNIQWQPEFRALWLHELLETSSVVNASFSPYGGSGFDVQGLDSGRDWAIVGGGLRWEMPGGWSLYGNYDTQINTQQVFHVGSAGAQLIW